MAIKTFDQQALDAQDQLIRTLGSDVIYITSTGVTKNIRGIFDNEDLEKDEGFNRLVAPQPQIQVKSADIINRDRDNTTFTVLGTQYRPDEYIDDGRGMITILLRVA